MRPGRKTIFEDKETRATVNKSHNGGYELYGYDKDNDLCRVAIPAWVTPGMLLAMSEDTNKKAAPYRKKKAKKPEAVLDGGE